MAELETPLRRSLSLPVMTFYGLGTILGAGIYALVGKVAGRAGLHAPLAFAAAALVAGLTAFSYAELAARLPRSAGEAAYVHEAFRRRWVSRAVGLGIVATGLVSAAAIANAFVGYLDLFVDVSAKGAIVGLIVVLGAIAAVGVEVSSGVAVLITCLELSGLLLVLAVAGHHLADLPARASEIALPSGHAWPGVFSGAFLAFYAFVGFEDMANMAEEVRDPERTMPRSIILAMLLSTLLYLLVATVAVLAVPIDRLSASDAPLATLVTESSGLGPNVIGLISLFAIINGALVQLVMAARVLYGMARSDDAPAFLGRVHARTRTPLPATAVVTAAILVLALFFPLVPLAEMTSLLILGIYALVNLACLRLQPRTDLPRPVRVPRVVPGLGFMACVAALVYRWL
ncbi:MAG: amino acid permease [Myxococcales bacterium]|nr:amino acid permease [Myxococcales bacterium]